MQGKGIVRFFLVLMTIVTIVQYLYILPTRKVEKDADEYAKRIAASYPEEEQKDVISQRTARYLDSMSSVEVLKVPLLKSFTYQELKAQQLAYGLDLEGGMSVVLQVDLREFIRALANDSKDPTFEKALETATQAQKNAQADYVTLFVDAFQQNTEGKKLAPIFARNEALRDRINFETTDAEVQTIIREKANETVDLTFKLLKERIDKLGVVQPNISLDAARDLILVELPGIDNPEQARRYLQATAQLEFWDVYRTTDPGVYQLFVDINERLRTTDGNVEDLEPKIQIDTIYATDSLGNDDSTRIARIDTTDAPVDLTQGPLFDLFTLGPQGSAILGTAKRNQIEAINDFLARDDIKGLIPRDMLLLWSKDPQQDFETGETTDDYELYGMKIDRTGKAPLTGEFVTDASQQLDPQSNEVTVSLKMDSRGAKIWGDMTKRAYADNNRQIAIVLDSQVVSAPRVNQPITSGDSQIAGNFDVQEAKDLANILQVGKLPAKTKIIQENLVGPSLGAQNISRSINALLIGSALLLVFMIFYYGSAGVFSVIALLLNLFFIFGALAAFGAVLTLPGFAGIVLTIGMAVDANVIIFERIREELREGKSMVNAIQDGFRHSYSAIIDANITTFLTAAVLAYFGLGPIKGFAVVLMIGVVSSVFTAVLVGKMMIDWWIGRGNSISFSTSFTENAFANLNFDWLGSRRYAYMVSGTVILLGVASMFMRGFELGVDFKGGNSISVAFAEGANVDSETLRQTLSADNAFGNGSLTVKKVDTENTYNIVTDYEIDNTDEGAAELVLTALYNGVNAAVGGNLDYEQFKNPDGTGTHVIQSSKVGPTIADDIKNSSYLATIVALLVIFFYILIRFSKWQYSAGAVAALFHDVLVVLGLFSIFHGILPFSLEIDQIIIGAILTVIGYSINDTVVVFDRIREFMNAYTKKEKEEIINMAVNSTISRTVITSLTTLFVVAMLFFFGGTSTQGFAFALLVGIIVGTYSSVFVATPIMSDFSGELTGKEKMKGKPSFSRAAAKAK